MSSDRELLEYSVNELSEVVSILYNYRDINTSLEIILQDIRKRFNIEAGTVYLVEDGNLRFVNVQNDKFHDLGEKKAYIGSELPIDGASIAGYAAYKKQIVNIKDVYNLPSGVDYTFNRSFDIETGYRTKSVIVVPIINYENEVISDLQLINIKSIRGTIIPFSRDISYVLQIIASGLAGPLQTSLDQMDSILRMVELSALRDPSETAAHAQRVGAYSSEIFEHYARVNSVDHNKINFIKDKIRVSAMLHDIGKVGVADAILKKKGPLTDSERTAMRKHAVKGAKIFDKPRNSLESIAKEIALHHHQQWDGSGYPVVQLPSGENRPLKGEEIPISARIVAIADVFDALTTKRSYKEVIPMEESVKIINDSSGTHFDPDVVASFNAVLPILQLIRHRYPS